MPSAHPKLRLVEKSAPPERELTDGVSLERAFQAYAPYVAKVGLRLLGSSDEVEDLVHDVFIMAQEGLGRLRDPSALKPFLTTIAVRTARRRIMRRQIWRRLGFSKQVDYSGLADHGASPEDAVLLMRAYKVLERLPADQRIAWTLRVLEGERLDKVAELCECSTATAKRRISAAHEAIREEIGDG